MRLRVFVGADSTFKVLPLPSSFEQLLSAIQVRFANRSIQTLRFKKQLAQLDAEAFDLLRDNDELTVQFADCDKIGVSCLPVFEPLTPKTATKSRWSAEEIKVFEQWRREKPDESKYEQWLEFVLGTAVADLACQRSTKSFARRMQRYKPADS